MADKLFYAEEGNAALRSWALARTLEGAGWGLVSVLGFAAIWAVIWVIGELLPAESKTAPAPNVTGALVQPLVTDAA
jgi:Intrinsic membrane protein PufX